MPDDTLQIFISSPGDVGQERVIAERVIDRLRGEFGGRADIEPVLWEHEPLRATEHFQEQITPPAETDIAVFILWSRLGTPLPEDKFQKESGEQYQSGTEWEFENAVEAYRETGTPDLLTYRKTKDPETTLSDEEALQQRIEQKQALESFVDRWFMGEEGTLKAAFHTFETPDEFERRLEKHLRRLIEEHLPERQTEGTARTARWHEGSPFRGLQAFEYDHAPVFFGRTKAVGEITSALEQKESEGRPFVLVLGPSGSGKSSVAKAGVAPTITQPGVIEGIGLWRRALLRPSDAPDGPVSGLAKALLGEEAVPQLESYGFDADELAGLLHDAPARAANPIERALQEEAEAVAEKEGLPEPPEARLLLIVDQMEELFTLDEVGSEERETFARALQAIVENGPVWGVGTMRSDFYPRAAAVETLHTLMQGAGQYALPTPSFAEIGQMIRHPAQAAGLRFEKDPDRGESLDEVLHEAATQNPEALPLLEFTLEELYQRRDGDVLTFEAYEALGGLEGALAERAEEVYRDLPADARAALPDVMEALVTIRDEEDGSAEGAAASRRVPIDEVAAGDARGALVDAFVEARLLITDRNDAGEAVVNVAHEALLREWPRLAEWIERNRAFLQTRARVQERAARWDEEGRPDDLLLPTGQPLAEARGLLEEREKVLGDTIRTYIGRSIERVEQQERRQRRIIGGAVAVFVLVVAGFGLFSYQQWTSAADQRDQSLRSQSQYLADAARQQVKEGDAMTGMLLALEALPHDLSNPNRPYVPAARDALLHAMHRNREESVFTLDTTSYETVRTETSGNHILAILSGGSAIIYNRSERSVVDTLQGDAPFTLGSLGKKGRFALSGGRILHLGTVKKGIETTLALDERVRTLELGPFGRSGVVIGKGGSAYVFRDGAVIDTITTTGSIQHARFGGNADELILAQSAEGKGRILRYALKSGRTDQVFQELGGNIRSLKISPDRKWVAAVSKRNPYFLNARVWDMETLEVQREIRLEKIPKGIPVLKFGPGDRIAFLPEKETPPLVEKPGTSVLSSPRVYNLSDRTTTTLEGHESDLRDLAFKGDGTQIATLTAAGYIRLWNVGEDRPNAEFLSTDTPTGFGWSGEELVTFSSEQIRIWNGQSHPLNLSSVRGTAQDLVVGPKGNRAGVVLESGIQFMALPEGRSLLRRSFKKLDHKAPLELEEDGCQKPDCMELEFGPNGQYAGAVLDAEGTINDFVAVFDLKTGKHLVSLPWRWNENSMIVFSNRGGRVAGITRGGEAEVFDLQEKRTLFRASGKPVRFLPEKRILLREGAEIAAYSIPDSARVWKVKENLEEVGPDGNMLLTSADSSLVARNARTGKRMFTVWEKWRRPSEALGGSVIGKSGQVVSWQDSTIRVFESEKKRCEASVRGHIFWGSAYARTEDNSRYQYVSFAPHSRQRKRGIIDAKTCSKHQLMVSDKETKGGYAWYMQSLLGDGRYLARSATVNGPVEGQTAVWKTEDWSKLGPIPQKMLETPTTAPYLWAREAKGELRATYLWHIRDEGLFQVSQLSTREEKIHDTRLDPNGRYAIAITEQGKVRVWPLFLKSPQVLIDSAYAHVTRQLTDAQREQFNLAP